MLVCVFYVIVATDRSDCQYTDNKMERQQRNKVSIHNETRNFNKEFTLFSRATSPVQLLVVALFYCAFKQRNYNTRTQCVFSCSRFYLVGWFLDSPSHLSTQTSSSYQLCDLLVYRGEPNVVLSPDRFLYGKA